MDRLIVLIILRFSQACFRSEFSSQAVGMVSLEFIHVLLDFVVLDENAMKIISKLHKLAMGSPNLDRAFLSNTLKHVEDKNEILYAQLSS